MNRFKELRKQHHYSQNELANILFVNQTAVSQWERGVTTPSPNLLLKLCDLYQTTTDYLLGRDISKIVQKENPAPLSESEVKAEKPAAETGSELSEDAQRIAMKASLLSEESRKVLEDYIDFLAAKGRQ